MISVNHATYVITIPKADTVFVETNAATGYEIRSYDEYAFMRQFSDYLDSVDGQVLPNGFTHNTSVVISGVSYARALVILAPYTVTFEDGTYQVKLAGGMNNNLLDVLNPNSVSVLPANSAGKQTVYSGGSAAPTAEENAAAVLAAAQVTPIHANAVAGAWPTDIENAAAVAALPVLSTMADKLTLIEKILRNKTVTDPASGLMTVYADDGTTPYLVAQLHEDAAGSQPYRGQGAERRARLA